MSVFYGFDNEYIADGTPVLIKNAWISSERKGDLSEGLRWQTKQRPLLMALSDSMTLKLSHKGIHVLDGETTGANCFLGILFRLEEVSRMMNKYRIKLGDHLSVDVFLTISQCAYLPAPAARKSGPLFFEFGHHTAKEIIADRCFFVDEHEKEKTGLYFRTLSKSEQLTDAEKQIIENGPGLLLNGSARDQVSVCLWSSKDGAPYDAEKAHAKALKLISEQFSHYSVFSGKDPYLLYEQVSSLSTQ